MIMPRDKVFGMERRNNESGIEPSLTRDCS